MVLEFQRAHGMRNALDGVRLSVGVIVHGVDAPLVARAVMLGMEDAVHHRIAHVQVRRSHVDFGAQSSRAIWKLAGPHALEQVQVLLDRTVAIRAVLAGLSQAAAILAHFLGRQIVHISVTGSNQLHGPLIELIEVVGCIVKPVPLEAEPAHIFHDRVDVLGLFLLRIGVVEAQIRLAAELVGQSEVEADCLGVPDVQVAVRLRRKARLDGGIAELFCPDIFDELVAYEIRRSGRGLCGSSGTFGI